MRNSYRLVIIGRPNVGKSTLFNRLLGRRKALVHNLPGVTRDRNEQETFWWVKGLKFPITLIDTGGLGGEQFSNEILSQVKLAAQSADLFIFLFDSQTGLTVSDQDLLLSLKKLGLFEKIPTLRVVNKVDDISHEERIADFFSTGLTEILTISAEHGRGIEELQQMIAEKVGFFDPKSFPLELEAEEDLEIEMEMEIEGEVEKEEGKNAKNSLNEPSYVAKVAIVGKPNVGKSRLINTILNQERMITSPIAGTTVDSVHAAIELNGKPFLFIDTAGIRRKDKTKPGIEVLSIVQTKKALEEADIALLVLDGELGITEQDEKIGGLIEEVGCSVVLVMNKWDTQKKNIKFTEQIAAQKIRGKIAFLKYAPILFVSALENSGLEHLGDLLEEMMIQRKVKLSTHEFTEWVRDEVQIHNPLNAKFFLCHQSGRHPPTFVCHVNDPDKVHFSLRRHLVNALRGRWGYMGSPVRILFLEGKNRRSLPKPKKSPTQRQKVKFTSPGQQNVSGERKKASG